MGYRKHMRLFGYGIVFGFLPGRFPVKSFQKVFIEGFHRSS